MKVTEIRAQAKDMGLKGITKMKKDDLIRAIQTAEESSTPCYGADWRMECQQMDCTWREDCQSS